MKSTIKEKIKFIVIDKLLDFLVNYLSNFFS